VGFTFDQWNDMKSTRYALIDPTGYHENPWFQAVLGPQGHVMSMKGESKFVVPLPDPFYIF
jgi:hypothetical protein